MKRVATVEELKELPEDRTIMLSKKRNKRYGRRYLLDLQKNSYGEDLIIDGFFTYEDEYEDYLPAEIIWQGCN